MSVRTGQAGGLRFLHQRRRRFAPLPQKVDPFMDGCVAVVQIEEFGLPKSGASTARQRSKIFRIGLSIFIHSRLRVWGFSKCWEQVESLNGHQLDTE